MKILTEDELAARLDFRAPLHPPPEEPTSVWCIPFEYGENRKGTRISIAKAKEIAAELRASVAESDCREMRRYYDREVERTNNVSKQLADTQLENHELRGEIARLKSRRKVPTRVGKKR